jgi:hypothetical protein
VILDLIGGDMAARFKVLGLIVFALMLSSPAFAEVRLQSACPLYPSGLFTEVPRMGSSPGGRCYSGHTCWVGVRGDWLDITDSTTILSGPRASIRISEKGVEDSGSLNGDCIPRSNKDREGYVRLALENISGSGTMRIRLNRAGGSDTINVEVLDGTTFVGTRIDGSAAADTGESKIYSLKGANLDRLRLKQANRISGLTSNLGSAGTVSGISSRPTQLEADGIVSSTETTARVRLTFSEAGTFSLENRLEFEGGEPPLNASLGWPEVHIHRASGAQNPPPVAPVQGGSGGKTVGSTTSSVPNLTPVRLFPERPLLRKINTLSSLMIPMFFCSGVGNNEEEDVDIPAFEWGVANDNRAAVAQPFSVAVLNGTSPLATQTVASIPESDTRTFRNWPGRPARIRVVKVTGPPLLSEYNNSPGCYIPNALAGKVTLDPKPLVIRVDSTSQITERNEPDNDLSIQ